MPAIKIQTTDDNLVSHAGLALTAIFYTSQEFKNAINSVSLKNKKRKSGAFSDYQIIISYISMLCLGKTAFARISTLKQGEFYNQILGLEHIPSEATIRHRLEEMPEAMNDCIKQLTDKLLKNYAILTTCLNTEFIPLDIDVSCQDNSGSKKEKVSCTYKMRDGFATIFSYLGGTGFMLDNELRAGSDHCNCAGTDKFILNCIQKARSITDKKILCRLDSGNDSVTNYLAMVSQPDCYYIVKHNIRRESKEEYYDLVEKSDCKKIIDERKTTFFYSDYCELKIPGDKSKTFKTCRVIRLIKTAEKKSGQLFLLPSYELDIWYTNLAESYLAEDIVNLYKDHATSEQFHSELKTDMDVERLPSGKFSCNKLIMVLANFAYNILKIIGQEALISQQFNRKRPVQRIRIKTVLQDIIYLACRFVTKSRQKIIQLSSNSNFRVPFLYVFNKFKLIC